MLTIPIFVYAALLQNFHHLVAKSMVKETKWIRCVMEKSAKLIGEDWDQDIKFADFMEIEKVDNHDMPSYFTKPLHGFEKGGNCAYQALYQSVSMRQIMRVFQMNPQYREESMMVHLSQVKSNEYLNVLDVGCGSGDSTMSCDNILDNANVTGIDLSNSMIRLANLRNPEKQFKQMDAAYLQYDNETIDIITSFAMFHEMPKEYSKLVIAEMIRVIKSDGVILIWDQQLSRFSGLQNSNTNPIEPFLESYALLNITYEFTIKNCFVKEFDEGMFKVWKATKRQFPE